MARLLLAFSILLFGVDVFSQPDPVKFGKFTPEELKPMSDSTNAGAVVLCDYDQVSFDSPHGDLSLIYEKHVRIKILSKEGYKWADVEIPYNSYQQDETVGGIEAMSVFLGLDGKQEEHELQSGNVMDETVYGSYHIKKFSIPSVKEQCVIEYKYKITSKLFFDLKERYFQWEIPVKWSELRTYIPNFFKYNGVFKNQVPLEINENKDYSQFLALSLHDEPFSRVDPTRQSVSVTGTYSRYAAKNIPAFIEEPFITSSKDCLPKMFFQMNAIDLPGNTISNFMGTWERVSEALSSDDQFGKVDLSGDMDKLTDNLTSGLTSSFDKMVVIYNYVKGAMRWNGHYQKYVEKNLKKPFEQKTGTSAEINLMLTAMLHRAALQVYPVIISTRSNGKIQKDYPMLRQFNHVINYVKIDSAQYLLDAIDPNVPYNELPANDINDAGLAINKSTPFWVSLNDRKVSRKLTNCILVIGNDGKITVESQISDSRHNAESRRNEMSNSGKENYLRKNFFAKVPDINILSSEVQNVDSVEAPLNVKLKFETSHFTVSDKDFIYLKPKLMFAITENPYKTKERTYPVDYNFLSEETFILNITCPDGYEISEMPKAVKYSLPDNSVQYIFASTFTGNQINIMTKLSINQISFSPNDYPDLKEIYNQIIAKEIEQVVMKKK